VLRLVSPSPEFVAGFRSALQRGWSPNNVADPAAAAAAALKKLDDGSSDIYATADDPLALGPAVTLPDGSQHARLPGRIRWMWDDAGGHDAAACFAGSIGLRWLPGTATLPANVLGHIGYSVVPWKQGRGHATQALGLLLPLARAEGLPYVELTTDVDNLASQRVITHNGGVRLEQFNKSAAFGGTAALRFRIALT
jgi:RimJ/RimL family protein N-acetyltransferase